MNPFLFLHALQQKIRRLCLEIKSIYILALSGFGPLILKVIKKESSQKTLPYFLHEIYLIKWTKLQRQFNVCMQALCRSLSCNLQCF